MTPSHSDSTGTPARRLRALYVVHKLPASLAGGWSLRSMANLAALAKFAEVDVVGIRQWVHNPEAAELVASARSLLSQYCSDLQLVNPTTTATSAGSIARRVLRTGALMSAFDVHPEIRRRVTDASSDYDILWLEGTFTAQYAPLAEAKVLTLVDTHNVESHLERDYLLQTRRPDDFVRSAIRLLSIRRAERRYLRHADVVIATSEREASVYRRWIGFDRVEVVPNAVDATRYSGLERRPVGPSVLFVGSLNYFPNRNGLRWFLDEIWPRVTAGMPNVHLHVVGDMPPKGQFPSMNNVTFTGAVDSLVPYLESAAVSICPLIQGGGTRLKVIEALAAGIPLVSTAKGVEGLELSSGDDLLIADDPAAFSSAVLAVLSDPVLARSLARRGQEAVTGRYTWDRVDRVVRELALRRLEGSRASTVAESRALTV